MWKTIRIALLLLVLATVALDAWRAKHAATDWQDTLHVAVYPINADGSAAAASRIAALDREQLLPIERFLADEARRYGVATMMPVRLTLQAALTAGPPAAPKNAGMLGAIIWSLKVRWWVWRLPTATPRPHVRLFVHYWDPSDGRVPSSHGLERGQIAIAHVFASRAMQRSNDVVIAHEMLHALGASDKYDPASLEPIYPQGYAEPDAQPRLPQRFCELMAGRLPSESGPPEQAKSLDQCLIGAVTAREIGFVK
ncbi:hypothetical protein OPU71_19955 [Niveibacterium sp. 24ML]|uniref:hypothetical protein n=1 Tax=Niveibacterium sp. 24ML TaxID=2985512 RepID=UPI002270BFAC|nr:hypothetical protein [Niveibacterium sp. 24ML]MCX9158402.1 hypothetical protein [Niveibacterium sp. 24ML]